MDSGKFLGYGLYVTYYLSQPVLNTSSLSRTVRDGMKSMFYKYFIFDCSLSFSFKAMHTLELQVFSELLFMRTVCEGSWTCLDKGK